MFPVWTDQSRDREGADADESQEIIWSTNQAFAAPND